MPIFKRLGLLEVIMMTAEERRLEQDRNRQAYWRRWEPYAIASGERYAKITAPMEMHGHTCRTTMRDRINNHLLNFAAGDR